MDHCREPGTRRSRADGARRPSRGLRIRRGALAAIAVELRAIDVSHRGPRRPVERTAGAYLSRGRLRHTRRCRSGGRDVHPGTGVASNFHARHHRGYLPVAVAAATARWVDHILHSVVQVTCVPSLGFTRVCIPSIDRRRTVSCNRRGPGPGLRGGSLRWSKSR